ncbi:MAG TPA: hypothetical protein VFD30_10755 [Terriglobia bacterium]|jgi:hypothetical protein|nr:hypothetical protein [Terriglobia bacterium]
MALQMYIVALRNGYSEEASRDVQRLVRQCDGYILMVTRTGPLIALDDSKAGVISKHPLVGFMGPVTLNPRGIAAERLQRIFAENLSKQLEIRNTGERGPDS